MKLLRVNCDVEDFLSTLELSDIKPKTVRGYLYLLQPFFAFVGKSSAAAVLPADMKKFLTVHKARWKANSYYNYVWKLRKFFKDRNEQVYKFLKTLKVSLKKRDIQPFTANELIQIANHLKTYRGGPHTEQVYYVFALFQPSIGARPGEVCGLNIGDLQIDGSDLMIHFRAEITKNGEARDVPLPRNSLAYKELMNYLKSRKDRSDDDPLFVNSRGNRLTVERVEAKYRCARRELGIRKKCTPHVNRHTFITRMIEEDVDVKTISELTGHDVKTLLKDYAHISSRRKKNAIKKVKII